MLDFQPTRIEDREWVISLLQAEALPLCDYSFPTLFCWQTVYKQQICRLGDRLLVHADSTIGSAYLWPVGRGDTGPALDALETHARAMGQPLRFVAIMEEHRAALEARYGSRIEIYTSRDTYDYLYDINRLADLGGKKLHAKRNHINRFTIDYPDWEFVPLQQAEIPACFAMNQIWYQEHLVRLEGEEAETLKQENAAIELALHNLEALQLDGGMILVAGEVVAFTMGARLTEEIYCVHFERAHPNFPTAYSVINREFARHVRTNYPQVKMLNREEDLGHLGLRRAKMSYGPDGFVENYYAIMKD